MKKKLLLAVLLCVAAFSGACVKDSGSGDSKEISVVTTIFAPYDFVREIAKDKVNVRMLLSPGEESHSFDPSPQDIIDISGCDLFIYNGGENEKWTDDILESMDSDINALKMMDCVDTFYEEEEHVHESSETGEHGHGASGDEEHEEYDEHVWTSPLNAIKIAEKITEKLAQIDSGNAEFYHENCDAYTKKLSALYDDIKKTVDGAKRKTVVFGDRFALRYFTEEFGLSFYAAFPGCAQDTEINPNKITEIIEDIRREHIPVVFKAELSNGRIAETIAEATGAKVRTFYSCHNISAEEFDSKMGYIDMMRSNLEQLKEALN